MTAPAGPTTLVKGQNAPVSASSVQIQVDVQAPTDLSALLVTDNGKVRSDNDFVFFNQPEGPGVRCVKAGAGWQLQIQLDQIPAEIQTVRAVVNLETEGQRFGQVAPPVARVADAAGSPIAEYQVTGLESEMIMVAIELYRRGGDWKVRAVGQGYAGGLADLISDHGVSVDDAGSQSAPAATPAPPSAAPVSEPDTGGAFGHLQAQQPAPQQPAPQQPAAQQDSGGAFGHLQPQQPAAQQPAAEQDSGGAFGHLQPQQPAGQQPAAQQDSGGAFGHLQPQQPAAQQPQHDTGGAFGAPPPPPPTGGFPPPAAPQGPPPQGQPAAFPPPQQPSQGSAYPPPAPPQGQPASFPPPTGQPVAGPGGPGSPGSQPAQDPGLNSSRPVSLQKGQRVSLRKDSGGDLTVVRMGLGWDPIKKRGMFGSREIDIDLDASAVMFADQQLVDVVFYNNLRSKDGAVQHTGDNRTGMGEGDDETVLIDLSRIAAHINVIVFIVTSYEGQTFEQVQNAFCRLIDNANNGELARYTLAGGMPFTGMVMAKVYRDGSGWKMQAIGEGMQARTPSDAFPQLPRFL